MTSVASTTSTTSSTTSSSTSSLTANFETFMTLLTTQLQAQDPLDPMDTSEFTNQLVLYSEVEQAMQTNSLLENLTSIIEANSGSYAASYLGKTATTTDTTAAIVDGQASWNYTLPSDAASVTLKIYDSDGKLVSSTSGETTSGTHTLNWDGTKTSGGTATSGQYTLEVTAKNSSGESLDTAVTRTGTISSIDMSGSEPTVEIGGTYVTLSTISSLEA